MNTQVPCENCGLSFIRHAAAGHCPLMNGSTPTKANLGDVFTPKKAA
jgi:hypothetical protein